MMINSEENIIKTNRNEQINQSVWGGRNAGDTSVDELLTQ